MAQNIAPRNARLVYLITYSRVDIATVPTRQVFADIVVDAFHNADSLNPCNVVQWVVGQEPHSDGEGYHYHMAVKLDSRRRWLRVRNYIDGTYGINVNFSGVHANYYCAWRYATKQDASYLQSPGHPDLSNCDVPTTTNASQSVLGEATHGDATPTCTAGKRKRKRMSVFDVSQIAVAKRIRTRLELLALANQQKKEGKTDLAQFIANRGPKAVDEAIKVGWELEEAEGKLTRRQMTRLDILQNKLAEDCAVGCSGRWLVLARDILARNGIPSEEFASSVRLLLEKGRGKYRNLYIKGPANCGKTFLLNPLNVIYTTFSNPATSTFAWVGAETAEVIFLNDFRWSSQIIPWQDLLLMLEGQMVHLPAPKSHYAQDATLNSDVPIFCTAKEELAFVRGGAVDAVETQMMRVRWKVFTLHAQIPAEEQMEIASCPRCFAELIL